MNLEDFYDELPYVYHYKVLQLINRMLIYPSKK